SRYKIYLSSLNGKASDSDVVKWIEEMVKRSLTFTKMFLLLITMVLLLVLHTTSNLMLTDKWY
ncbi:TPA: hypothetical protein ACGXFQ_003139, partial [Listeria monocytogenes]|nr:hypothetical protein [Listeria monocytogenes]EAD3690298.1 hypothetical protein [Listeria monocytogenes]MIW20138.1 hypothetical protein [Listeria monocytogenes]